jgi:hypothetical protein
MTSVRLLTFVFALCFAGAAQAQFSWIMTADVCVPAAASVAAGNLQTNVGSVQFAAGKTGQIVLNCRIEPFDTSGGNTQWVLQMTYQDSTGANAAAFVSPRLYTQVVGASPQIVKRINSNSTSATGGSFGTFGQTFTHEFNFNGQAYWVRVILDRSATNQIVAIQNLAIYNNSVSDIRLKHSVALLGRLDNGLGFYRFSYNGSDAAYVGVMAQEVETIMPGAVMRGDDGYLRVNYARLGLRMQTWEDWVASGGKIPATAVPATPASMRQ